MKMQQMWVKVKDRARTAAFKVTASLLLSISIVGCASWEVQDRINASRKKIDEIRFVLPKTDYIKELCAKGEHQQFLANYNKADSLYKLLTQEYDTLAVASLEAHLTFRMLGETPSPNFDAHAVHEEALAAFKSEWQDSDITHWRIYWSREMWPKDATPITTSEASFITAHNYWLANWDLVKIEQASCQGEWFQLKLIYDCDPLKEKLPYWMLPDSLRMKGFPSPDSSGRK